MSPASNSTAEKQVMGDPGLMVTAKFTDCMPYSAKIYAMDGTSYIFVASSSSWTSTDTPNVYKAFVRFPGTYTNAKIEVSGQYQSGQPPMWKIKEVSSTDVTITN